MGRECRKGLAGRQFSVAAAVCGAMILADCDLPPRFRRGGLILYVACVSQTQEPPLMQMVSPEEKAALQAKREELFKAQLDVQDRIRKAASLGDLSENAEYHFAKEENRNIQRQLAELEARLRHISVVSTDNVPEDVVFLGHTVKLQDLDDDSEQLVRLVGEAATPDANSDILPVSVNSPMGEALMQARAGGKVKVRAPRRTVEFRILGGGQ